MEERTLEVLLGPTGIEEEEEGEEGKEKEEGSRQENFNF